MTRSETNLSPSPGAAALSGAVRLLADSDRRIAAIAREWLLRHAARARPAIRAAAQADDVALRLRARSLLRNLDVRRGLRRLQSLQLDHASNRRALPLLQGALLVSDMVRTFAPPADGLRCWLREEAAQLRRRFAGRSLAARVRVLVHRLHGELGLGGGEEAAATGADAAALPLSRVLLEGVLRHGTGVPVALSLLYLLVGRRAGLAMSGVGLPGHFLVRIHGPRPLLVDPFHGGRTVTKADCVRFLRRNGLRRVGHHMRDLSDREVLAHYLRELRRTAQHAAGPEARATLRHAQAALENG